MSQIIDTLKKMDFWVLGAVFFVILMSLSQLYFIEKSRGPSFIFEKQLIFFLFGLLLTFIISFFPSDSLKNRGIFLFTIYLFSIFLLFVVLFFAPIKRGVESWLTLGPIDIQPTEIVKITTLLVLAKYFATRQMQIFRFKTIFISSLYSLIPVILIAQQPDLGSAMIVILLWLGLVFLSGIKIYHFIIFIIILSLIFLIAWNFFLSSYQKDRVISFLSPQQDPLGKNYSALQAKIAIAYSGFWGKGWNDSFQTAGGFLPEPHSDFIFASFVETRGLLGAILLIGAYLIILIRLILYSLNIMIRLSNFARLFCLGYAILLFSHIVINIGINLHLFPVTGIPLPFFSYGGSYLISLFIALGIYQSFFIRSKI